jgi:hypothetical protein
MANADHLDRLRQGVDAWNAWTRRGRPVAGLSSRSHDRSEYRGARAGARPEVERGTPIPALSKLPRQRRKAYYDHKRSKISALIAMPGLGIGQFFNLF